MGNPASVMGTVGAEVEAGLRRVKAFVKTTVLGGLVFLAPLSLLGFVVYKGAGWLQKLARPLAKALPLDTIWGVVVADVLVVLALTLGCFAAGLVARASIADRFVRKAEAGVLWRIPGYGFIKSLTATLDKRAAGTAMRPVLIHFDDAAQMAFEIEQLVDGRRVIYFPSAPDLRGGSIYVMDADRVESVPLTFVAAIGIFRKLGRGLNLHFPGPRTPPATAPP